MSNLKEMTDVELKEYLSAHRNNDDVFSEALSELLSRTPDAKRYPADMPPEEIARIIREQLESLNRKE